MIKPQSSMNLKFDQTADTMAGTVLNVGVGNKISENSSSQGFDNTISAKGYESPIKKNQLEKELK